MATIRFKGIDKYIAQLQRIGAGSEEMVKRSIYTGAGIVADSIARSMASVPTRADHFYPKGTVQPGPTQEEKNEMMQGFGLSKMQTRNGIITVKAGFAGRSESGVTVATLARRVESGTSWMHKTPFVRSATNAAKAAAEEAMRRQFDEDLKKMM